MNSGCYCTNRYKYSLQLFAIIPLNCLLLLIINIAMKKCRTYVATVTILLLLLESIKGNAVVVFVNGSVTASGNGSSWAAGYKTLHEALVAQNANSAITEIWIKAGTYYPTALPITHSNGIGGSREYAFALRRNLAIYGGFAGTETTVNQRVPGNATILSGDIGVPGDSSDNCLHVVIAVGCRSTTKLDGVTITGGNANGGLGYSVFGIAVNSRSGGGFYSDSSTCILSNCILSNNRAVQVGGGMFADSSYLTITNCTFSGNSGGQRGGGIFNRWSSHSMVRCVFTDNIAIAGGGMYDSISSPNLLNCVFENNITGSIYLNEGGGLYNVSSSPHLTNCVFSKNTAYLGGGAENVSSAPVFTNCTFAANNATQGGAAMNAYSATVMQNCILWNNIAYYGPSIYDINSSPAVTYSDVGGGYAGEGNVIIDPGFTDVTNPSGIDGIWGTADDGLALRSCSPLINTGTTPPAAVSDDILGNARTNAYDMGAYELLGNLTTGPLTATNYGIAIYQSAGTTTYGDCNSLIATILANGNSPLSGHVTSKVFVQSSAPSFSGQPFIRRYYQITPDTRPTTATASITLYFSQADFDNYNANRGIYPLLPINSADTMNYKANLRITQQHGSSSTGSPGSYTGWAGSDPANVLIIPTTVTYNNMLSRWEVIFPVTGFSGFFAHTGTAVPLPVTLLTFTGVNAGEHNRLNWTTAGEDEISGYIVERSANGSDFKTIGEVNAKGKNSTYNFYDNIQLKGISYYRLNMGLITGAQAYSSVVAVNSNNIGGSVTIWPIPAIEYIIISNTNKSLNNTIATIMDMQGSVMSRFIMAENQVVDISKWKSGIYTLKLANGETTKIIRQ